jgi:hypothetical protein
MGEESEIEREFALHLGKTGNARTVDSYLRTVRRFLKHVGEASVDRISEEKTRAFFANKAKATRYQEVRVIGEFLAFAAARLPAVIDNRGSATAPVPAVRNKKELALRQRWSADTAIEKKRTDDDLIAKLARKLIDHYVYFQGRMKGEPENLDDVYRFADECKELIENNLPLFMSLSAQGRNIHSKIDERIQR